LFCEVQTCYTKMESNLFLVYNIGRIHDSSQQ
jgi:hypothetical protein